MTTVVNTPPSSGTAESGSGVGVAVGALVVVALIVLFLIFGLPLFRGQNGPVNSGAGTEDANINLPDKVNVDVNGLPGQAPQ